MFAAILVAALVGSGVVRAKQGSTCSLILQDDLEPLREPLVLANKKSKSLDIPLPEVVDGNKGVVYLENNQQLLLACLGRNNYNKGSGKPTAYVSCDNGELKIGRQRADKQNLACTRIYTDSSIKVTKGRCGSGKNSGVIVQLGFELDDKSWFPLVDVCHDLENSVTLYSAHKLYGHSLKGGIKSSERRQFTRGPKPLYSQVSPDSVYVRRGQEKAFDKILGKDGHNLYINATAFLARGHLAPDADFIYNSGQLMTYYYVNVAPQWQDFNAGNWLDIENTVRNLAVKEDKTINVYTGTFGVLKLTNAGGEKRMMYLEPTKKLIPVPELFWKLVQNSVTKDCTVVVSHNNVFLKEPPTPICTTAKPSGWPTLKDLTKGYTYYCDYESFRRKVTFAPVITCKDLFEFPKKTN